MHRYFAAGIWLVLTITATFMVWEAVSVVAADVTDRPAPVVAQRDVAVALKAGSSTTVPTRVAPPPPPPTTTVVTVPATTPTTAHRTAPTTVPPVAPTTTVPVTDAPTTTVPGHPTTIPQAPPTTAPPPSGATATYSNGGGVVLVQCTGPASIRLVAALPEDGFQAAVITGGPNFVYLTFIGLGTSYQLGAGCAFGQPYQFPTPHRGP